MNSYSRDIIIQNINSYHEHIKGQIEKFFDRQRDFQFHQSIIRDNEWQFLNSEQMSQSFKLEKIRERSNTILNIELLKKTLTINELRYISLINILSKILLKKFLKSEKSFGKFIFKLRNNSLKTCKQKELSKKKKIITKSLKKKIDVFRVKSVNVKEIDPIIKQIEKLNFTTEKALKKRIEVVQILKKVIENCQKIEFNFSEYVNYLPDHIFNRLKKLAI
jgi:hypothetical protein